MSWFSRMACSGQATSRRAPKCEHQQRMSCPPTPRTRHGGQGPTARTLPFATPPQNRHACSLRFSSWPDQYPASICFFTGRTTRFTTLCITQFFSGIQAGAFSDSQKLPTLSPGILRNPSSRNPRVYDGAPASRNTQFHLVLNSPSYVFLYLCWSCCCSAGARWLAPVSVHSAKTLS